MGRYMPPDIDPSKTNTNALHRRRAPGTLTSHRQRTKNADGTTSETTVSSQTVRFEMPFPIWCGTCPKPTIIGQGVRFNARKSAAGKYHSTTIWRFDMRHAQCGGEIAMQTDPKNTAYIVLSGATKRSARDSDQGDLVPSGNAGPIITDAEREDQRQNAFSNLEKTIADRDHLIQSNERISSLLTASSRHWDDPYAQNQKLRRLFRVGRKKREKEAAATEELQERMGLGGMELLPESEEDRKRAALVEFGPVVGDEQGDSTAGGVGGRKALSKPLFNAKSSSQASKKASPGKGVLKAEKVAAQRKDNFVTELMDNTRAVQDPFLIAKDTKGPSRLPGVKRKRDATDIESDSKSPLEPATSRERLGELKAATTTTAVTATTAAGGGSLVDYDSD